MRKVQRSRQSEGHGTVGTSGPSCHVQILCPAELAAEVKVLADNSGADPSADAVRPRFTSPVSAETARGRGKGRKVRQEEDTLGKTPELGSAMITWKLHRT